MLKLKNGYFETLSHGVFFFTVTQNVKLWSDLFTEKHWRKL